MSDATKRIATDQTLQDTNTAIGGTNTALGNTNTALGLLGKDSSLQDIKAAIIALPNATQQAADNANAAATAANTAVANLGGLLATTYSSSATYAVGDYVYYNSHLYRCITAITTAEAWTAAHWEQVHLGDDVTDLKSAFDNKVGYIQDVTSSKMIVLDAYVNTSGVAEFSTTYKLYCFEVTGRRTISSIVGTDKLRYGFFANEPQINSVTYDGSRLTTAMTSISNVQIPSGCKWVGVYDASGGQITVSIISRQMDIPLPNALPSMDFDNVSSTLIGAMDDTNTYTNAPSDVNAGVFFSFDVAGGIIQFVKAWTGGGLYYRRRIKGGTFNQWVEVDGNASLTSMPNMLPNNTDFDDVTGNTVYVLSGDNSYPHFPPDIPNSGGWLFTFLFSSLSAKVQIYIPYRATLAGIYLRSQLRSSSEWTSWRDVTTGETINYNTSYTLNHYENTFTATVSPTITTDTNNYLQPTGTSADVKASIEAMLTSDKVCRLAPGDFYVSGIDMPENSMLIGSGPSTRVILLGAHSTEGYAIHLNNRCSVKDMSILGSATDRSYTDVSETIVQRHGILFEAEAYDGEYHTLSNVERCNLENLCIKNFTGGGITAYNTGYGVQSCMNVVNVYIYFCNVGINISFFSEFHRFTNVHVWCCFYGSINNGGNNYFTNCCFGRNRFGMLMDNSTGSLINEAHGAITGCVFAHTDKDAPYDNNGIGLKMVGLRYGEVISGCEFGFSDIVIDNCQGIQFNDINLAARTSITVTKGTNGKLILFNNMIVMTPNNFIKSIENGYSLCKFNNCWDVDGNAITA